MLHETVLELKAVKLTILTFKKQKSLKTGPFEIENTTALLYFVKIGSGGGRWQEENQMLLKVSKEI